MKPKHQIKIITIATAFAFFAAGILAAGENASVEIGAADEPGNSQAYKPAVKNGWVSSGYLNLKNIFRFVDTGDLTDTDDDLVAVLRSDFAYYEKGKEKASVHLVATGRAGIIEPDGILNPLSDVYNFSNREISGEILSAYADMRDAFSFVNLLRAGRQTLSEGDGLNFDGLRANFGKSTDLQIIGYAGFPTDFFGSFGAEGRGSFRGGGLSKSFGRAFQFDANYVFIREADNSSSPAENNELFLLKARSAVSRNLMFGGRWLFIDGQDSNARVESIWRVKESDFILRASVVRQNSVVTDSIDPAAGGFFPILGQIQPYHQYKAYVSKGVTENADVRIGIDIRELLHTADEGIFNHSFRKYFAGIAIENCVWRFLDLDIQYDVLDAENANYISALAADAAFKFDKSLKMDLGTDYQLYKFDPAFGGENARVRSFFARLVKKYGEGTRLEIKYSFEKSPELDYHRLELGLRFTW